VEPGDGSGPTAETFEVLLNEEIEAQIAEGMPLPEVEVRHVAEAHPVPCNANASTFETAAYADLVMEGSIGDDQKADVEGAFRDSYNRVAFGLCDREFRGVFEVELVTEAPPASRRQMEEDSNQTALANVTFANHSFTNATLPLHNGTLNYYSPLETSSMTQVTAVFLVRNHPQNDRMHCAKVSFPMAVSKL